MSKHEEAAREIKVMILADPRDRPWEHEWDVANIVEILRKHFPDPGPHTKGGSLYAEESANRGDG